MNLVEFIFKSARELDRWQQPAILYKDYQLTYEQLNHLVRNCGQTLKALNIASGDRVAIIARDCPEFIISFLGTAAIGSVSVPISTMLAPAELEYILNDCGAKMAIITPDQIEKLQIIRDNLPRLETILLIDGEAEGMANFHQALSAYGEAEIEPIDDETLAFILYTSGSTGKPKGAMHVHRSLPYTVNTYCKHILQIEPEDRLFSSSRLFFAYGLGNSLSFPLSSGAAVILCQDRPTPQLIAKIFSSYRPTIFFGVPAVFRALIEHKNKGAPLGTESLKLCVSAGESLPAQIFHEWKKSTGLSILDGIGSTEMLHIFISNRKDYIRPGSSGAVVPGYEAKIVDQSGNEIVAPGAGNLMIKGLSASPGYWNNPEKTAATMQGQWMRTGDVYRRDEEGVYWFEGRSDDLFKVKGLWVSPIEIEDALLSHPDVLEAAIVPGVDKDGINIAVAFVVLKANLSPDDTLAQRLKSHASSLLPSYKCPAEIHFIDQLPRTATGKLQRFKLRDASHLEAIQKSCNERLC